MRTNKLEHQSQIQKMYQDSCSNIPLVIVDRVVQFPKYPAYSLELTCRVTEIHRMSINALILD